MMVSVLVELHFGQHSRSLRNVVHRLRELHQSHATA